MTASGENGLIEMENRAVSGSLHLDYPLHFPYSFLGSRCRFEAKIRHMGGSTTPGTAGGQ